MHTGPTTSPENSFCGKLPDQDRFYSQISFSPAFDMSILRQCCNAYSIASAWASSDPRLTSDSDPKILSALKDHSAHGPASPLSSDFCPPYFLPACHFSAPLCPLPCAVWFNHLVAASFCALISRMKNSANPLMDESSQKIVEYPVNQWIHVLPNQIPQQQPPSQFTRLSPDNLEPLVLEASDWAHRHFSSLHWLYPGIFIPSSSPEDESLLIAAQQTLQKKSVSLGGHTGSPPFPSLPPSLPLSLPLTLSLSLSLSCPLCPSLFFSLCAVLCCAVLRLVSHLMS
jgi:hypothetical protein